MNIDVGRGNIEENVDKFQLKAEIMFCAVSHNYSRKIKINFSIFG